MSNLVYISIGLGVAYVVIIGVVRGLIEMTDMDSDLAWLIAMFWPLGLPLWAVLRFVGWFAAVTYSGTEWARERWARRSAVKPTVKDGRGGAIPTATVVKPKH